MKRNLLSNLGKSSLTPKGIPLSLYKVMFLVILLVGFVSKSNAQVSTGYNFNQLQNQTYVPITGGTVFASGGFTNVVPAIVPLGFTFNYNGTTYTNVYVTDNGFLVFTPLAGLGANAPIATTVNPISSGLAYPGAVSAFGYNLQAASTSLAVPLYSPMPSSEVRYETITVGAQKVFVLQYTNVSRRSSLLVDQKGIINMQIRLYETTNIIETLYNTFDPTAYGVTSTNVSTSQQVGLRGASNTDFNNRTVGSAADWSSTAAGTGNTNSMSLGGANLTTGAYNTTPTRFIWTPCFQPSGLIASMQVDNATATISWTAATMPPVGGYDWEVRTSGNPGSGSPFASGNTTTTSVSVPGLQTGITYYIYIKSNCKTSWLPVSVAPSSVTVLPVCSIATIPYSQNFEGVTPPAIPNCTTASNSGTTLMTINRTASPLGGFANKNLVTFGSVASNSWYFTQQINFPVAGYYKLSYKYGGTNTSATQKMKVAFGATNSQAGMTTVIADHDNIKTSPLLNTVNFFVSAAGNYYVGFNAYAAATQGALQLDDIYLDYTTCIFPTALASSQVGATSANISWTAPASAPSGGYEYYLSTSSSAPLSTVPPTGATAAGVLLTSLTSLTSSTTYYYWVRSICGGGDISAWTAVSGTFTTAFQPVLACTLTTPPTATTTFFNNITTTGATTNINNSSGLSPNGYGDYTNLIVTHFQGGTVNFSTGIAGPSVGVAIWVDWNNNGTFEAGERVFNTTAYVTTLSGSFNVPGAQPLGEYRMRFLIDYWNSNPTDPCTLVLNTSRRGEVEDYTFKVVSPPPALTLNIYNSTQCANVNSPLVQITAGTGVGEYSSFSWNPSTGVSGNSAAGYTFNSNSTITYTLTASQSVSPYNVKTATFTYAANPLPTALVITPSAATLCGTSDPAVQLVATGGIVSGGTILSENFNTGAAGWTTASSSIGGIPANANWTIRNSGYNPGGSTGITQLISNDNSQFYLSNSDSQGSAGTTDVQLISPTFSLAGYSDASLSFYHHVRPYNSAYYAKVEIWNPLATPSPAWQTLQTWVNNQGNQGTATNFALVTLNLNAYLGQSGLQIRFNYYDRWGFVWAVDNVNITGSTIAPTVTWTPNGAGNGLYTDSGATTLYSGASAPSVYAKPTATQIYTATVTTPLGCSVNATATVTFVPISIGTTSANQTISVCSGPPISNITVSAYTGTAIYWEYTDDPALLTGWTTIPSSNSTTLTVAQIGSLANTRYFRAVATNSTCILKSAVVTITIINAVTWNGFTWSNANVGPDNTLSAVFNGNYTSTADLNACSVSVVSGTVLIKSTHTLNVQYAVQVNAPGALTFENNSSLVQYLTTDANSVAIANSGSITYIRETAPLLRLDYTYWSSPVSPQTLGQVSPTTPLFYEYNSSLATPNWVFAPSTTLMTPAKGYIIRAPNTFNVFGPKGPYTASLVGRPNTGDYSIPVYGGSNQMNLIGNPYPCAVSATALVNDVANISVIDATLYFWTHSSIYDYLTNTYAQSDYAVWNKFGGVNTYASPNDPTNVPLGFIAAGQSFFIKGLSTGNAIFKNSMRVPGNNGQFFRTSSDDTGSLEKNRIWLEIFNSNNDYKQILLGYVTGGTNAIDRGFDSELLDVGNNITLYTKVADTKLTIQGKGLTFSETDTFALGYKSLLATTYTIKLSDFDGLFLNQSIYLEDTNLDIIHDLKSSPYIFNTAVGTFENRFILRFNNSALSVDDSSFSNNTVTVFKNESDLVIKSNSVLIKEVQLFDVRGRLIASANKVNELSTRFTNLPKTNQVLLVKITSENGIVLTKKVVF